MPRVIPDAGLPPAFIIEEEEIETFVMPPFVKGGTIPLAILIDDRHHCHIELNHSAFNPKQESHRFLKKFLGLVRPDRYFQRIAPSIVDGSLLCRERHLIGGMVCHYYSGRRQFYIQYWGILTREQLVARGLAPPCRRGASRHHVQVADAIGRRLGAKTGVAATSTPAVWKATEAVGWYRHRPSLVERWQLFIETFPVSLRRKGTPLLRRYD